MDPDVQSRLDTAFEGLGPRLKQAAQYILDHPDDVAMHSMRTLAARAGVAPATLSRLARAVDYVDYDAFRKSYQTRITGPSYAERARALQKKAGGGGVAQRQARTVIENIERFVLADPQSDVEAAAEILLRAGSVRVVGLLSSFALAAYAHYVASIALPRWSLLHLHGGSLADALHDLAASDAVLAFASAPYARSTVLACREAKARGAKLVAVTDRRSSPLARVADVVLIADTESPSFFPSIGAQFAVLEGLLATILRRSGGRALAKLEALEEARHGYREYWDEDSDRLSPAN